ncbi:MAG: response regulator [Methylococcaceae bacterium]|nr:MAG: response regulator [Methylococcaceae bacterium]
MKKILIVDDSRVSRMLVRTIIQRKHEDWVFEEAGCGEDALKLLEHYTPDLITVDVNMPGMSGLDAARQMHAANPAVAIFVLTANIQDSTKARAADIGVEFVEKPITEERVHRMIAVLEAAT